MGRGEKRELASRLKVLLTHLLKWQYQVDLRSKSWRNTIAGQREDVAEHLAENPSLKDKLPAEFAAAYRKAIRGAAEETGFDRSAFPAVCPWTYEQAMDAEFWPADTAPESVA